MNWNNKPSSDGKVVDYQTLNNGNWYTWDLTVLAREWYNTGVNYGIMLDRKDENSGYTAYWSSDISDQYKDARPSVVFEYVSNIGLESYWTYHSQDVGRAGTGYVNDSAGNLVYVHNDLSMNGNRMPATVNHIYNNSDLSAWDRTKPWLGRGWTLNVFQRVDKKTIGGSVYYIYTDEDGTKHYFKDSTASEITDELNIGYTLVKETSGSYTIKDKKDNKISFNSDGSLNKFLDNNGNTITAGYSTAVNNGIKILTKLTDGAGRITALTYDNNGLLYKITDPSGRNTFFNFDTSTYEVIQSITYPDGKSTYFTYDSNYNLIGAKNIDGIKMNYEYTTSAPFKVKRIYESNGNTLGNEYNIKYTNNKTQFTDEKGRVQIYQFDNFGKTLNVKDPNQNVLYYNYSDENNKTKLGYISKVQKTTVNYLKNHNLESDSDWIFGNDTNSDASGSYTNSEKYFGQRSLMVSKTNSSTRSYYQQSLTLEKGKTYTYSGYIKTNGISNTNQRGAHLLVHYKDSTGVWRETYSKYVSGTTDWSRYEVTFTIPVDATSGDVIVRNAIGNESGTAYFDCLQLEDGSIENRYNLVENSDFTYGGNIPDFWGSNGLLDSTDKAVTSQQAPFHSGASDRSFMINGDSSKQKALSQFINVSGKKGDSFVLGGWIKGDSVPTDNNKRLAISVGFQKADLSGEYEWYGVNMDGASEDWQYISRSVVPQNDYNKIVVYLIYYKNSNSSYFDGIQLYKEEFGTSYQYDSKGNVVSSVDLEKQKERLEYNGTNDLISSIDPKGNQFKYTYDSKHNLITATSAANVVYTFSYDANGNPLTSKVGDTTTFIQSSAEYTDSGNYIKSLIDSSGNKVSYNYDETKGLLNSLTDSKKSTTYYTYDSNTDNLLSTFKIANGKNLSNSYVYENDRIKAINHNDFSYSFGYDSLGNNTTVNAGNQNLITNTYEDRTGRLTQSKYGNNQIVAQEYDSLDRVIAKSFNGTMRYRYTYDNDGNLGIKEDLINGVNYRYKYDLISRPIEINDSKGNTTRFK